MNYPAKVKRRCIKCGRPWLWVCALGDGDFIPVLMCDSKRGCGSVFELSEYGNVWF
jgi:hypothetical protein